MGIKKKFKKLLATVLSAAFVLTMTSATALADENGTNGSSSTEITGLTFTKVFESTVGGITPNETFTFSMTPIDSSKIATGEKDANKITVRSGKDLGANATTTIEYTSLSPKEQQGTFSFANTTFEGPYVYRYIVKEVIPASGNSHITYDTTEYTVDVTVDASGKIISVMNVTTTDTDTTNKKPIVFTNKYDSSDLVIRKTVKGTLGDTSEKFKFQLDIPVEGLPKGEGGITLAQGAPVAKAYYEDSTHGTRTEAGTVKVGEVFNFSLADGEQICLEGVPNGMIYTVTELEAQDYTTNITCTTTETNEAGSITETRKSLSGTKVYNAKDNVTPTKKGENLVEFENVKDYNADTGVRLDVIPYIVVFIIAIAGVSAFIFFRRKKGNR